MNKHFLSLTAALALAVTGCESTGSIAARTQEKSTVFATLKPWEKKYIEKGSVAVGFTPDMVYMALGRPTKTATRVFPDGSAELWTYARVYPSTDAIRGYKRASFTLESAFQAQPATQSASLSPAANPKNILGEKAIAAPESSAVGNIHQTGGPQGESMQPADLPSHTIQILFENGRVARMSAVPNPN